MKGWYSQNTELQGWGLLRYNNSVSKVLCVVVITLSVTSQCTTGAQTVTLVTERILLCFHSQKC
jgi:hypothetical protein